MLTRNQVTKQTTGDFLITVKAYGKTYQTTKTITYAGSYRIISTIIADIVQEAFGDSATHTFLYI